MPTRADLGRFVRHAGGLGVRLGQSDHLVSEAFYLQDPDGHGIEVYRDRPRGEWRWVGGEVRMAGDPIDLPGLLLEAGPPAPWTGLPDGTVMGHVHLRVADLGAAEAFYAGTLGFDVVSRWPGALFVSVGGYHHHLGLNTWQSLGGEAAPGAARTSNVSGSTSRTRRPWTRSRVACGCAASPSPNLRTRAAPWRCATPSAPGSPSPPEPFFLSREQP